MHTDLLQRLKKRTEQLSTASATEKDKYLMVVARLSREDAKLMEEAIQAIKNAH